MQRSFSHLDTPAQVIDEVTNLNDYAAHTDTIKVIQGRPFQVFTRLTTQGQVKTFQVPLDQDRI